jgi:hypothetical protein
MGRERGRMRRWKRRFGRTAALATLAAVGFVVSLTFTSVVMATEPTTGTEPPGTTTEPPGTTTGPPGTTTEPPGTTEPPPGPEGCTPGYWKNHLDSWGPTGYSPSQDLDTVFDDAALGALGDDSLLEALSYGGGPGVTGAKMILLRAAVASLLNAAHPDVSFGPDPATVIAAVNAALVSGDRDTMLSLASDLDARNNAGCPLN